MSFIKGRSLSLAPTAFKHAPLKYGVFRYPLSYGLAAPKTPLAVFLFTGTGKYVPDVSESLMKECFDESAARTDIVLREARLTVDKQYRLIAERLGVIIAKYAALLARRGKHGGSNEATEEMEAAERK